MDVLSNGAILDDLGARFKVKPGDNNPPSPWKKNYYPVRFCPWRRFALCECSVVLPHPGDRWQGIDFDFVLFFCKIMRETVWLSMWNFQNTSSWESITPSYFQPASVLVQTPYLLLSFIAYSFTGALLCPRYVAIFISSSGFLQAVARPKFSGPRSASIARSQVWLGLPNHSLLRQMAAQKQ